MPKHPKRPRDTNQLAHMIVGIATGDIPEPQPSDGKNPAAVALGKLGGAKGGKARAERLTAAERKAISQKAAQRRWSKS